MPSPPPVLSATPIAPPKRAGNLSNDGRATAGVSSPGGRVASGQAPQTVLTAHRLLNFSSLGPTSSRHQRLGAPCRNYAGSAPSTGRDRRSARIPSSFSAVSAPAAAVKRWRAVSSIRSCSCSAHASISDGARSLLSAKDVQIISHPSRRIALDDAIQDSIHSPFPNRALLGRCF